jgi:serine protease
MDERTPRRAGRTLRALGGAVFATVVAGAAAVAVAPAAGASSMMAPAAATRSAVTGPGALHGAVPVLTPVVHAAASAPPGTAAAPSATVASGILHGYSGSTPATSSNLTYGGAVDGVGVVTGTPQVYLVYYGSQWGTQKSVTVGGRSYATFSGDPAGMAPVQQEFFAGLGTGGETWSGVVTQYCQGIVAGGTVCPAGAAHVGHPTAGVLAGVWEDSGAASPASATPAQLAAAAEAAATHFGNSTPAANRDAQYVIVSPTGTHPDGYDSDAGDFCAWHDYTADPSLGAVAQPDGVLAFTNMPYLPDLGTSCGKDFVNHGSAGLLDGVSIVGGHEYAETLTDPYPAGGWTNSSGSEAADLCAWISSGQGAAADITTTTGTFAVQSIWADDFGGGTGGCELSHPVVTSTPDVVTVLNPHGQSATVGTAVALQVTASDTAAAQTLGFSAVGLPAGLSISASGRITGTPTTVGTSTVTVRATDTTSATAAVTFAWKVVAPAA